jgi:hypothetical protein
MLNAGWSAIIHGIFWVLVLSHPMDVASAGFGCGMMGLTRSMLPT